MAEKIEKSIPWFAISAVCALVIFGAGVVLNEIIADSVTPSVTVGNVAPTVGAIILNAGNNIVIIENTTANISGTTTLTDANGYGDIVTVTSTLYLNNTTCGSGLTDPNWCYYISSCATSSCSGNTCVASCTANVWFVAEPSDASGSYPTKIWQMDMTIVDSGSNVALGTGTEELNTAYYLDVDGTIAYGNVNPSATSAPNQTTNATNTGNAAIDTEISGVDMATGALVIAADNQKYSSSTIGDWATDGTSLTSTAASYNLDLAKPTATTSNSTDDVYWVIYIPTSTSPGVYDGTNTFTARSAM